MKRAGWPLSIMECTCVIWALPWSIWGMNVWVCASNSSWFSNLTMGGSGDMLTIWFDWFDWLWVLISRVVESCKPLLKFISCCCISFISCVICCNWVWSRVNAMLLLALFAFIELNELMEQLEARPNWTGVAAIDESVFIPCLFEQKECAWTFQWNFLDPYH